MWPGRPPARASTSRVARSTRSHGPKSSAPSRFPCTPRSLATASQPTVERDAPVEPDHVAARGGHLREQRGGAGAEVDRRAVDGREDPRRVRLHELLVVGGRQRPDPGVEELDHVGARSHLGGDVRRERRRQLLHQRMPELRLGVHHPLHLEKLAARLPLDEVAGDGEGAAAEADHGLVGPQLAADERDRLEDERDATPRAPASAARRPARACGSDRRRPGRRSRRARHRRPSRGRGA